MAIKGYKNKGLAIMSTFLATGVMISIGYGFWRGSQNKNTLPNHPPKGSYVGDSFDKNNINSPYLEPDITTNPSETDNTSGFEGFVPGPNVNPEEDIIGGATLDQNMLKVLALLTNETRDYFEDVTGKTTTLEHLSVEYINLSNEGVITIYGKGMAGSSIKRIVSTIKNPNTTLDIYNLNSYVSNPEQFSYELSEGLEEILNSPQTTYTAKAENYYKISNQNITREILQNYLNNLKISNGNRTEIEYLTELLSSSKKIDAMIIDPTSTKTNEGNYKTTFTVLISTSKYGFTTTSSFETPYQLLSKDRYSSIENHLATNTSSITIESIPQSAVNNMLTEINNKANELNNDNSLTQ